MEKNVKESFKYFIDTFNYIYNNSHIFRKVLVYFNTKLNNMYKNQQYIFVHRSDYFVYIVSRDRMVQSVMVIKSFVYNVEAWEWWALFTVLPVGIIARSAWKSLVSHVDKISNFLMLAPFPSSFLSLLSVVIQVEKNVFN